MCCAATGTNTSCPTPTANPLPVTSGKSYGLCISTYILYAKVTYFICLKLWKCIFGVILLYFMPSFSSNIWTIMLPYIHNNDFLLRTKQILQNIRIDSRLVEMIIHEEKLHLLISKVWIPLLPVTYCWNHIDICLSPIHAIYNMSKNDEHSTNAKLPKAP